MSAQNVVYLVLTVLALYFLFTIGFPFLIAFLIALMLEPLIQWLSKKLKDRRLLSSALVCSAFTLLIFFVIYLVVIKGFNEGLSLSKSIISFIRENNEGLLQLSGQTQSVLTFFSDYLHLEISDLIRTGIGYIQSFLSSTSEYLITFVSMIPLAALDFLIFIMALYLISFTIPTMKGKFLSAFDPCAHHKIETVSKKLYAAVLGFIRAQLIISFFIFLLSLVGLLILDVKYAIALSSLITIVDILPVLGTGSVLIPMSLFYFITGDFFKGLGLLVLYVALIGLRRTIEPKILGDAIGIGALPALAGMYIGFKIAGFIGLFLGPATIILVQALINADIIQLKIKF